MLVSKNIFQTRLRIVTKKQMTLRCGIMLTTVEASKREMSTRISFDEDQTTACVDVENFDAEEACA